MTMTPMEIYNLVIAAAPVLASIVTFIVAFVKIIGALSDMRKHNDASTDATKEEIKELRLQNDALRESARITQENVKKLTKQVQKVIDKVDENV